MNFDIVSNISAAVVSWQARGRCYAKSVSAATGTRPYSRVRLMR